MGLSPSGMRRSGPRPTNTDMDISAPLDPGSPACADAWPLDPAVAMLNHGSFGACPRPVLQRQAELRQQMEAEPVRFLVRELPSLLDQSRRAMAELIGAEAENLVFVLNATAGVNAVVRSLRFRPGEELLITNHGYNACHNVVRYVAERHVRGGCGRGADPHRVARADRRGRAGGVTQRTRLALLDHITSPTAIVFPIEETWCGDLASGAWTLWWTGATPRAWFPWICGGLGRPITRAIATSGSAPRRGPDSFTCGRTGKRDSSRR